MKQNVHNELEARVLIKEAYSNGEEVKFNDTLWFTHSGEYLFKSLTRLTEYELIKEDHSITEEL